MKKRKILDLERLEREKHLRDAAEEAARVLEFAQVHRPPVDPRVIASAEDPLLRVRSGDYRNCFDGRLEYHPSYSCFILFYNTKYDAGCKAGQHAPRTRFSLAHELGHYFIEAHHQHLRFGGQPHPSRCEFVTDMVMERQADMFAAHLLMPRPLFRPLVNQGELTLDRISELADTFQTSFVSTAIHAVRASDFCPAIAGIRNGAVAWTFVSQPLIEAGFYPGSKGQIHSPNAPDRWAAFQKGDTSRAQRSASAHDWFRTYTNECKHKSVIEEYLPAPVMDTLLVLLHVPEDELDYDED